MGYDVHITRAEDWVDSENARISLGEWIALVERDPEMELRNAAEAKTTEGVTVRYENEGLAVWVGYSGHGVGGNGAWFDHRHGRIIVKNPDDEILARMQMIAGELGARVQGDEGELYDPDSSPDRPAPEERRPWWRRLFRGD